jgi:hypothetical protein
MAGIADSLLAALPRKSYLQLLPGLARRPGVRRRALRARRSDPGGLLSPQAASALQRQKLIEYSIRILDHRGLEKAARAVAHIRITS